MSRQQPQPGDVLRLTPENARYLDEPVLFRVIAVRPEVSGYYDGAWIWVEGEVLGEDGPVRRLALLVRVGGA